MIKKGVNKDGVLISLEELKNSHFLIKDISHPNDEQINFLIDNNPAILLDFINDQSLLTTDQVKRCLEKDISVIQFVLPIHYHKKEIYEMVLKENEHNFGYFDSSNKEMDYFLLSLDSDDHKENGLLSMINSPQDQELVDYAYSKNYKNLMHTDSQFISQERIIECLKNKIDNEEKYKYFHKNIELLENFETKESALNHFLKTKFLIEEL